MDVGVGLPNAVKGTSGEQLTEFARRADEPGTEAGQVRRPGED